MNHVPRLAGLLALCCVTWIGKAAQDIAPAPAFTPAQFPVPQPVPPPPLRPAGMDAALAEALRRIGPKIDGAATAAVYAPVQAAAAEAQEWPAIQLQRDLAYGPHGRHRADVFRAEADAARALRPVLVFVHGGGFARGAKSVAGSPFYDNIGYWAARHGLLGVTVNYRLAPEHAYPAGAEDLARLLAWLRAKARSLGGDPSRIVFWGHSAGAAHVADFLVREPAAPLAGAILTSGIYSLGPEVSPWKDYYGSDPAQYPDRESLGRLAAVPVPLLVNHAELDPPAFVADTLALLRARAMTGQQTRQLRLPAHSHISETYAIGTHDRSLAAPVLEFIQSLPAARLRR